MYILHKFMTNLDSMFPAAQSKEVLPITSRIMYTFVLNSMLFGFMLIQLSLQIYHENLSENKPANIIAKEHQLSADTGQEVELLVVGVTAGLMLPATIIVPLFSLVVFVLANYYYVLELFIKINIEVINKKDCREKLEGQGDMAKGIMGFASKNIHATPGRLRDIQSLSTFQRVFYVLREWWIDLIFLLWAFIIVGYCVLFYFYYKNHVSVYNYEDGGTLAQQTFSIVYVCSFMVCVSLFILANYHSFAVVFVTILIMVPLFLSFAIQGIMDKIREASGKGERKKDNLKGIISFMKKEADDTDSDDDEPKVIDEKKSRPPSEKVSRPPTVKSGPPSPLIATGSRPPTQQMASDSRPPTTLQTRTHTLTSIKPRSADGSPTPASRASERMRTDESFALSMTSVDIP